MASFACLQCTYHILSAVSSVRLYIAFCVAFVSPLLPSPSATSSATASATPSALPFAVPSALLSVLSFVPGLLHDRLHGLQCVDKMRSCYGNDDIRVGAALHNMAGLYLSTKPPDYHRAEAILREALDVSPFLAASHLSSILLL